MCPPRKLSKDGSAPPAIAGVCIPRHLAFHVAIVTDADGLLETVGLAANYSLRIWIDNSSHDQTGCSRGKERSRSGRVL